MSTGETVVAKLTMPRPGGRERAAWLAGRAHPPPGDPLAAGAPNPVAGVGRTLDSCDGRGEPSRAGTELTRIPSIDGHAARARGSGKIRTTSAAAALQFQSERGRRASTGRPIPPPVTTGQAIPKLTALSHTLGVWRLAPITSENVTSMETRAARARKRRAVDLRRLLSLTDMSYVALRHVLRFVPAHTLAKVECVTPQLGQVTRAAVVELAASHFGITLEPVSGCAWRMCRRVWRVWAARDWRWG